MQKCNTLLVVLQFWAIKTEPEDLRSKPHTMVHFIFKHAYYNTFVDLYITLIYDRALVNVSACVLLFINYPVLFYKSETIP